MQYADLQGFVFQHFPGLNATDAQYVQFEPRAIDYAELRLYRDLDLQITRKFATATFGNNSPQAQNALLQGPTDLVVCRGFSYFTPVGSDMNSGTRVTLKRRDERFLGRYWPNRSATSANIKFYAEISWPQFLVAPTPDAPYLVELAYTYRPPALGTTFTPTPTNPLPVGTLLSGANQVIQTYLTGAFPDLFLAAAMVFFAGAFKNYGASSDDPRVALSWENRYQGLLQSATVEEGRRKSQVYADMSKTQPPAALSPN